ncbi:hypothetical protein [Paraliobacillus sp. JSM ZJ581]|uniref:hypothetical protein n=1 Tax=Paraliobacillus sp. JSM ZJ581 TaxID=3342118 RepID=UPI0035A993A2
MIYLTVGLLAFSITSFIVQIKKQPKEIQFDLMIYFEDKENCPDITKNNKLMAAGDWRKQGPVSFRGWSRLNKKDISTLIAKELQLETNQFKVISIAENFFGSSLL